MKKKFDLVVVGHLAYEDIKTGSGDVLAGIFLVLLARGSTIKAALKEAVRMASFSITDFGVEHLLLKYNLE